MESFFTIVNVFVWNIFVGGFEGPWNQGEFQNRHSVHLCLNTHLTDVDPNQRPFKA